MITACDLAARFGLKCTGRDWRDVTPRDTRRVPIANMTADAASPGGADCHCWEVLA
jgi:hypothetical protein